jgi:hypothetical protein
MVTAVAAVCGTLAGVAMGWFLYRVGYRVGQLDTIEGARGWMREHLCYLCAEKIDIGGPGCDPAP